jgi:hypothetical protein
MVSGGFTVASIEDRFFQLSPEGSLDSKRMPVQVVKHCMVAITNSKLLVIGGFGTLTDKATWLYAPSLLLTKGFSIYLKYVSFTGWLD